MTENKPIAKCAACGAYLFPEDDTVYCPECGAPHHRECYNSIGHCAYSDKHGTSEQYSPQVIEEQPAEAVQNEGRTKCQMCGCTYDSSVRSCPNCGTPNMAEGKTKFAFNYDFLGGIPSDMDLGEGVTADEAKQFVFVNSGRYLPKFAANKIGKKTSWNWLAFLFPAEWFLSRKMYLIGSFVAALQVAVQMLMFPFIRAAESVDIESAVTAAEQQAQMMEVFKTMGTVATALVIVALVLTLALRILCGMFGDYFYRNYCISTIKEIKQESEDREEDFRKKGGVNFFMFVIGLLIINELPGIIMVLF